MDHLRQLDTCAVSDALDRMGLPASVVTELRNLTGDTAIAGRVVTVELGATTAGLSSRHLCTAAIEAAGTDDVLVIDHQGRNDCAGWGGNLSRAAAARGAAGTLVYGAARDIDEAAALGFPVYATAATPHTARRRAQEHAWNRPISFAGCHVSPGDYVIADRSGVVFIEAADIERVLEVAEGIAASERRIAKAIAAGTPVSTAMGTDYEQMTATP